MTAGMTGGTTVGNAGKSVGAFATDLTADVETLSGTGALTSMAAAGITTATVITVKDSAEAIFRPIVNMPATGDGNRLIAHSTARVSKRRIICPLRKS
jgi:hypothetical protein